MKDITTLLSELTIPEKAALLEGYQSWMTNAVPRLEIPSVYLTDGPIGVRKKANTAEEGVLGLGTSYPSTAFPTSVSIANSWNVENAEKMGRAIGEECVAYDVDVLLGPALNLKRDPRCGRNFEYYSEDPLLAGKMAAAFTRGVQSTGTAACPKHFALNNSENFRYMGDSVVDERAARELYLKPFEICVKEAHPRTMMCSYNKVNGIHASENKWLLTDVLRGEWGFDGLVMSDWGAVRDRVAGVKAGLDLDMPGGVLANRGAIVRAARSGELSMEELDRAVANVLKLVTDARSKKIRKWENGNRRDSLEQGGDGVEHSGQDLEQSGKQDCADNTGIEKKVDALLLEHNNLAAEMAADCAVLLKNEGVLPLTGNQNILVVGELFEQMRYQGAGSSGLCPRYLTSPRQAFDHAGTAYTYAKGYRESTHRADEELVEEALRAAEKADVVLFFGGLTELFESEGFDRKDLSIPENQLALIDQLCALEKKVVVVLFGGSPVELPFEEKVAGILNMFLPGQNGGEAARRILYGEANPGGKLSETWMKICMDIPCGGPYSKRKVEVYRENIYVGYRYFDKLPERIRYPFGYGLSYTTFEYSDLTVEQIDGTVTVSVTVTNTGVMDGSEVVQLYVGKNENTAVFKAEKELKAFAKVYLKVGESKTVEMQFAVSDLSYYHTGIHAWTVENGEYPVLVGASSRDIRLTGMIEVSGFVETPAPYSEETVEAYENIARHSVLDDVFVQTIGRPVPKEPEVYPFTLESPLRDYQMVATGRWAYNLVVHFMEKGSSKVDQLPDGPEKEARLRSQRFTMALIPSNCPRSLIQSSGGMVQMNLAHALNYLANGQFFRAIAALVRREKKIPLPCEEQQ